MAVPRILVKLAKVNEVSFKRKTSIWDKLRNLQKF